MKQFIHRILRFVNQHFRFLWLIGSVFILLFALYISSQISLTTSYNELKDASNDISNNLDRFFEDLFQEVYALPVYGKKVNCNSELYPLLEHITLNNPNISGVILRDKEQSIICSTLPMNDGKLSKTLNARTILGPFTLKLFDQPTYVVKQQIGNLYVDLIVVASVISKQMQTSFGVSSSVALFNSLENKNILRIEQSPDHHSWMTSPNPDSRNTHNFRGLFAVEKLQSINDVSVVVFENSTTVKTRVWLFQIILSVIFSVASLVLYYLFKMVLQKRYSLHGLMKVAVKKKEFFPVYQPLFNQELARFTGVEVLLRWKDEENNIIMPDVFISEAEITGLIIPITLQIIDIALKDSKPLLKNYPNFHIAFNVSALHFTDPYFFSHFYKLIEKYSISSSQILLEITERDLLDKNDSVFKDKMLELRQKGFSLAVDDYGTGHASISYLQHFPFNYLKIDKLFIQAIGTKAITESLNDAIIQMAKGLGLIIIAEGVETAEQVDFLTERSVGLLQGWFYSKALSIQELAILLKGEIE